jgi:hypothetical protein
MGSTSAFVTFTMLTLPVCADEGSVDDLSMPTEGDKKDEVSSCFYCLLLTLSPETRQSQCWIPITWSIDLACYINARGETSWMYRRLKKALYTDIQIHFCWVPPPIWRVSLSQNGYNLSSILCNVWVYTYDFDYTYMVILDRTPQWPNDCGKRLS